MQAQIDLAEGACSRCSSPVIPYVNNQGQYVTGCSRGAIMNRMMGFTVLTTNNEGELAITWSNHSILKTGLPYDSETAQALIGKTLVFTTAYIMPIPETDNQEGFLLGFHSQIGIDVTTSGFKPEVSLLVPLGRIVESLAEPIPQLS
jgi:hypothetical protein